MSRLKLRLVFFSTAAVLFMLNTLFSTYLASGLEMVIRHFLLILVSFFILYMVIQDSVVDKEKKAATKTDLTEFSTLVAGKLSQKGKREGEKFTLHEIIKAHQEAASEIRKEKGES